MNKNQQIILGLALLLSIFFVLDLTLHFVLVPIEQLNFSLYNPKGDIDFTNLGFINMVLRGVSFIGIVVNQRYRRFFYGVGLALIASTTVYLMVDSLWVFWNYLSLYGYWFFTLFLTILLTIGMFKPKHLKSYDSYLLLAGWVSMGIIALVYMDIMGFDWPREFVYAYVQRIVFEGLFFVLGVYLLRKENVQ
jgi:hypothetical protein